MFFFVPACQPATRQRWPPCAGRIGSRRAKHFRCPVQAVAAGWGGCAVNWLARARAPPLAEKAHSARQLSEGAPEADER